MKKYEFDHAKTKLIDIIGVEDSRADELLIAGKKAELDSPTIATTMEAALNAAQPKSMVEALFLGFYLGKIM